MKHALLVFLFLAGFSSLKALGADYFSPRTAALAGSGVAAPLLNDAIYLNPSFGSFLPSSSLALGWTSFKGDPEHGRNYNVSIQDGRSELFQAGFGFTQREDGRFVHFGAAKAAIQRLGFGIGGKYALTNGDMESFQEISVSSTGLPLDWLTASIVADNLIQGRKSKARGFYRNLTIGTKWNVMGIVIAYVDPHYTPSLPSDRGKKFGANAGLEFVIMKDLFLRAGGFQDAEIPFIHLQGRGLGLGAGWVGPRMSFDYGYLRVLGTTPALSRMYAHQFGVALYF